MCINSVKETCFTQKYILKVDLSGFGNKLLNTSLRYCVRLIEEITVQSNIIEPINSNVILKRIWIFDSSTVHT